MGLPSQNATGALVESLGLSLEDVREFWYRGNGWPGKATAIDRLGRRHEMSYGDSWGQILCKDVQFRCKICPDGFGEFADISCGDAWHIRDGEPIFEERPGRSLVFVRTDRGREVFRAAERMGYLATEPLDVNALATIQPSQVQRRLHVGGRILALKLMGDRLLQFSGFSMLANVLQLRPKSAAIDFLGMVHRRLKATP
jgi:coenzyme F420 hydrogenase subunit beta